MLILDDLKLKYKLFFVYLFCVFCPILVINLIFYHHMVGNVKTIQQNYYRQAAHRIISRLESDLGTVTTLCNRISLDRTLYETLDREFPSDIAYVETYYNYLMDYIFINGESYPQINKAVLYTDNNTILNSGSVYRIDERLRSEDWFQQVVKNPEKNHLLYGVTQQKPNNTMVTPLFAVRVLNLYKRQDRYLKFVHFTLNTERLMNIIITEKLKGKIFIFDRQGKILFADHVPAPDWQLEDYLQKHQGQVVIEEAPALEWTLVSLIDQQEISRALREPQNNIIMQTAISLLVASVLILWISRSFYDRLNSLSAHVNTLVQEGFNRQYTGHQGNDEIGMLIKAFNQMVVKIRSLIHDVYEAKLEQSRIKLEKKEAELNALQSQMNPHFLYNTLESIRMRSVEKGEKETAEMIKRLTRSFQRMSRFRQEWVNVAEEVRFIKDFLSIQQYRFGPEFQYTMEVHPAILEWKIPKLVIQPFVENACLHGIEGADHVGKVEIILRPTGKKLYCMVKDNGIGMAADKLHRLWTDIKAEEPQETNIAIRNIYQRLRLYYGEDFRLRIDSAEGQGTTITLVIPVGG
ncbi:MAG TPA: sensor histidine kinase [Firmicutes bacterium]|jgi:two-component system sensor histidine kinase YesM|nr:sensor histidine kinase [Bacillota bacterium]